MRLHAPITANSKHISLGEDIKKARTRALQEAEAGQLGAQSAVNVLSRILDTPSEPHPMP